MQHVKSQKFIPGKVLKCNSYLTKYDNICTLIHLKLSIVHYSTETSTTRRRPSRLPHSLEITSRVLVRRACHKSLKGIHIQ
jgi:hypothetical protein